MRVTSILVALCFLSLAADAPPGRDWPQFLGPARNGSYAGNDLVDRIEPGKVKTVWKHDVGSGWASPVVVDGKVLLFHRVKDEAVLECLEADSGKVVWTSRYETNYVDGFGFDNGPRSTPAVADGRVFTYGSEGMLTAWELATGKRIWQIDTVKEYGAQPGFFGLACSPVVEGKEVIVTVGGRQAKAPATSPPTVAGFSVDAGLLRWAYTTPKASEAGYASPTVATLGGKRRVIGIDRDDFFVLDLDAESRLAHGRTFRSRQHASVNAATPLIVGDEVFISASYDVGAKLLRFDAKQMDKPTVVWESDDAMSNHYATCVVRDGFLYGFHGRQETGPELRCVEWATGKVRWKTDVGAGTVTLAGDKLLVLTEKGELLMAAASPDGFKELGKTQILGFDTRASPAIANGRLYARGKDRLVCVDLRK